MDMKTVNVNDEEKGLIDDREQPSSEDKVENCEHEVPPGDTDQPTKPLFGSSKVIFIFSLAQILARPFIITVNIVYLILRYTDDLNQKLERASRILLHQLHRYNDVSGDSCPDKWSN